MEESREMMWMDEGLDLIREALFARASYRFDGALGGGNPLVISTNSCSFSFWEMQIPSSSTPPKIH